MTNLNKINGDSATSCPNTPLGGDNQLFDLVQPNEEDVIMNGDEVHNPNNVNQLLQVFPMPKIPEYRMKENQLIARILYYEALVKKKIQMKQEITYDFMYPLKKACMELTELRASK